MADIKISELSETTDLNGLYTIGTDKNNASKKVSLQFLKEAANYANMQGDYAKEVGDSYGGKLTKLESENISMLSFVGKGDTYVRSVKKSVVPGHIYKVYVPFPWEYKTTDQTLNLFVISYFEGTKETPLTIIKISQTIDKSYIVEIPQTASEGVLLCFGGRSVSGEKKSIFVQDITNIPTARIVWFGGATYPNIDTENKSLVFPTDGAFMINNEVSVPQNLGVGISFGAPGAGSKLVVYNTTSRIIRVQRYNDSLSDSDTILGGIKAAYNDGSFINATFPFEYLIDGVLKNESNYNQLNKSTSGLQATSVRRTFETSSNDLEISDDKGNVIVEFKDGHLKTLEFDSRDVVTAMQVFDHKYEGEKIDLAERAYAIKPMFELQNKSNRQSIAVYGNYMVSCHLYGDLYLYDLATGLLLCSAKLPVSDDIRNEVHGSNVSFGVEFASGNSELPYLYICETTGARRCFVVDLKIDGNITLLQTIKFDGDFGNKQGNNYHDFLVDVQNHEIIIVGYYDYRASGNYTIVKKVPLKSVEVGDVNYTDNDVVNTFTIPEITVIQGAFVINNHLFIGDQRNWIVNIDMTKKKVVGYIKLNAYTSELEGIAPYQGKMVVDIDGQIKQLIFKQ